MLRITWRTWLVVAAILVVTGIAIWVAVAVAPSRLAQPIQPDVLGQLDDEAQRLEAEDRRLQSQNAVRTALLQAVGGVVLALGLAATWVTVFINRQGQITERFTRAVDQLGNSESVDVRLGGIYALQRIARESKADRLAIVSVLAELIRRSRLSEDPDWWGMPLTATPERPVPVLQKAPDVHAAAIVIGELHRAGDKLDVPSVYLVDASLQGANLRSANLRGANLRGANLKDADLKDADLKDANLKDANLKDADLRGTYLKGADLRGAYLESANLRYAHLGGADLRGANLGGANLRYANLAGADLWGAFLMGAHLWRAHLESANLGAARLGGASLRRANLIHADLRVADLQGAKLWGADLRGANLEGAFLGGARLRGADLAGTHLEGSITEASMTSDS